MTVPPELAAWLRPMGLIAAEVAVLVAVAALVQSLVRSPAGRRALWQACVLGVLILLAAELSGVGRDFAASLAARPKPQTQSGSGASSIVNRQSPVANKVGVPESSSRRTLNAEMAGSDPSSPGPLRLRDEFRGRVAERIAANRGNRSTETAEPVEAGPTASPVPAPSPSASMDSPELTWIGLAWSLGAGLLVLRVFTARLLSAGFRLRSRPARDSRLVATAKLLAQRLGLRSSLCLNESARLRGPIAFGVLRPTIILPVGFTGQFSEAQQDAMLAHEIAHLAARDPLWHFLADLAAALLWWHPLVWWARRRLHVANEAAADLASLLIADGPQVLAECLVELGNRLTQREALGWLGVTGFRSQLGRRVEYLLSLKRGAWRPLDRWRSALAKALGTLAVVALILFGTAWALPQSVTQGDNMKTIRQSWKQSLAAFALLASAASEGFAAQTAEPVRPAPAVQPAAPAPAVAPAAQNAPQMDPRLMERYGLKPGPAPASATEVGPHEFDYGRQRLMEQRYGIRRGGGAPKSGSVLDAKLEQIRFDEVVFQAIPLPDVLQYLNEESRNRDAEKKGVNFLINPNTVAAAPAPAIDPTTGPFMPAPAAEPLDMSSVLVRFNLPLREVRLKDVLDAIVKVADKPIRYTVEDYAVVFSQNAEAALPSTGVALAPTPPMVLAVRTFKVATNNFTAGLEHAFGIKLEPVTGPADVGRSKQMQSALRQLLTQLGIAMEVPGKSVFYNELTGVIMVRGTVEDLEIVAAAVETLGGSANDSTAASPAPTMSEEMMRRYGFSPVRR